MPQDKKQGIPVGDVVLTLVGDTTNLEQSVSSVIERMERALAAFKAEWNRKD